MNEYDNTIRKLSIRKNYYKHEIVKHQSMICKLNEQLKEVEFDIKYAEQVKQNE